jgi:hypothetical protein
MKISDLKIRIMIFVPSFYAGRLLKVMATDKLYNSDKRVCISRFDAVFYALGVIIPEKRDPLKMC